MDSDDDDDEHQSLFDMPTSFSLDKHLVVGLLYHMLALVRHFEASAYSFS